MPEYSSPLGMPINTGDSGFLVKSEEYLAGCLYENKIKEVSITVPVKQPTSANGGCNLNCVKACS